ncbi:MAG: glycerophosphodiester phosphodiesterase [Firmicutes bacterium]|nr:glycerophosphodiester phosphodiesterase [Bacillota bacterium]
MNKGFILGLIAGAAAGLAVFAVAPRRPDDDRAKPFQNRYFAHRGLYSRDGSVPENSIASFTAAVNAGYGIELDIQLSKDEEIVVFHDEGLKRMCGIDGPVYNYTLEELKSFKLLDSDESIPTLSEVLSIVDGRVPIIIEFKGGKRNRLLCEKAMEYLREYDRAHAGPEKGSRLYCVESFDFRIVFWFRRHAPDLYRGQLANAYEWYDDKFSRFLRICSAYCIFNFVGRPHFIAYGLGGKKTWTVKLAELLGAKKVCWTSHDPEDKNDNDSVIFEFYKPPTTW